MYPAKSVTSRFCCTDWPRCVCPSPSSICGLLLAESGDVLVVCLMKISLWSYLRAQHSSRLHCLLTVLDTGSTGHKICCCKVNWGYCKVTPSRVALPSKKGHGFKFWKQSLALRLRAWPILVGASNTGLSFLSIDECASACAAGSACSLFSCFDTNFAPFWFMIENV
ncbi:uncharacterized protein LOC121985192 isoform X3 [Zingiber officinale]|uniref:uncharacterized protein LOC121985192 isoform X3 n=1 Tax=Zingiber officinale TaxID=94328 RepID=UPI001C4B5F7B|nr:uncharacterized protein LOC121985192 isoform X3 [Zingiber officinale]